jgi:hypothetical protein
MYTIFFISFLTTLALHVSGASCTHHQEHNCSVQCVIPLVQVLVWETFTLKHGQLQKEIKNIVYIYFDLNETYMSLLEGVEPLFLGCPVRNHVTTQIILYIADPHIKVEGSRNAKNVFENNVKSKLNISFQF